VSGAPSPILAASFVFSPLRNSKAVNTAGGGVPVGEAIDGSFGDYRSLSVSVFFEDRAARHVSYLGYAPTVLLYRQVVGPAIKQIEGEAFQIDFQKDPDAIMRFLQEGKPLPKKHRMAVRLGISRELWFGIGPMSSGCTWSPVFEKRISFCIEGYESRGRSLHVSSYDPTIVHVSDVHRKAFTVLSDWCNSCNIEPTLEAITRRVALDFIAKYLRVRLATLKTVNRYLSTYRTHWAWLMRQDRMTANPWDNTHVTDRSQSHEDDDEGARPFEDDEVRILLTGSPPPPLSDLMMVAALTATPCVVLRKSCAGRGKRRA
jgi:hypothetical protein